MADLLEALTGDREVADRLSDRSRIAAMVRFEIALAEAEAEQGLIAAEAGAAIAAGLAGFDPDMDALAAGLARDGVVVPALVRQLRAAVGEPHGRAVHHGATSQDLIDTALTMQVSSVLPIFARRIRGLVDRLDLLSETHGKQALMAHTRMQRALPFTVAAKVETWRAPVLRTATALADAGRDLAAIQLGGPVGDGASFGGRAGALAGAMAPRLGLRAVAPWHSGRDRVARFGAELSVLSGVLGKFGADVALMAQNERGEVRLSGGGTSSAMAHKANPVKAEVLVTLARRNAGLIGALHQALVHENERSGAAWTLEWLVLPEMLVTAGASLRLAEALVAEMCFPG